MENSLQNTAEMAANCDLLCSLPVTVALSGVMEQTRRKSFRFSTPVHTLLRSAPLIRHLLYSLSSILGGICDIPTE